MENNMIRVTVSDLVMTNVGFAVLLKGDGDPRSIPIFIGAPEAQSISIQLGNEQPPRPLTHDLLRHILESMDTSLERVDVCDLRDGTFFAEIVLRRHAGGDPLRLDARPSDGIALALRMNAPIFVHPSVMNAAGRVIEAEGGAAHEPAAQAAADTLQNRLAARRRELDKAVEEERYEDAAKLRDEIKRLESESASRH